MEQLSDNLRAIYRATTIVVDILSPAGTYDPSGRIRVSPANGNALRALLPGFTQSDDDFLGNAVYTPGTSTPGYAGDEYQAADLVLVNGNSNGTIRFRTVNYPH